MSQVPPGAPAVGASDAVPLALPGGLRAALEAVLMVVESPVAPEDLAEALDVDLARVLEQLAALVADYRAGQRGFELREVAGGWRITSRADLAGVVARFTDAGPGARLSRAALETLAVVAYRQPVTRAQVSAVRGVDVDGVVRTLLSRGLVEEAGREGAGGAVRYRTSALFLEVTGLSGLDDLPALAPFLPADTEIDDLAEVMG